MGKPAGLFDFVDYFSLISESGCKVQSIEGQNRRKRFGKRKEEMKKVFETEPERRDDYV